jgi:hypothetical protein
VEARSASPGTLPRVGSGWSVPVTTQFKARGCGFIVLMSGLAMPVSAALVWLVFFTLEYVFDVDVSLDWAFGTIMLASLSAGPTVAWLLSRSPSSRVNGAAKRRTTRPTLEGKPDRHSIRRFIERASVLFGSLGPGPPLALLRPARNSRLQR